jgi:hypothetical protein
MSEGDEASSAAEPRATRSDHGLASVARALAACANDPRPMCYLVGGEGSRRLAAALEAAGLALEAERGEEALSAAVGASCAGASVWLLASGGWTSALARAIRASARAKGAPVRAIVASHGDDVGEALPLSDGTDLAALAAAPCARWLASSADEIERFVGLAAGCAAPAVVAFDLRSVGLMHRWRADGEGPSTMRAGEGLVARAGEGAVALVSAGAGDAVIEASRWLGASGVSTRAVSVASMGALDPASMRALPEALAGATHVLAHELGADPVAGETALSAALRWAAPRARIDRVASGAALDAAAFCRALARVDPHLHRRALAAASRSLPIQLVGPIETRGAVVSRALELFAASSMAARAIMVEPSHALLFVDVGEAGAVGSPGWVVVVWGLPVQPPLDAAIGEGAMIVDAGPGSALIADRSVEDQAALVLAVALAELTVRGQAGLVASLEAAVRRRARDRGLWALVGQRAAHLRSLR